MHIRLICMEIVRRCESECACLSLCVGSAIIITSLDHTPLDFMNDFKKLNQRVGIVYKSYNNQKTKQNRKCSVASLSSWLRSHITSYTSAYAVLVEI